MRRQKTAGVDRIAVGGPQVSRSNGCAQQTKNVWEACGRITESTLRAWVAKTKHPTDRNSALYRAGLEPAPPTYSRAHLFIVNHYTTVPLPCLHTFPAFTTWSNTLSAHTLFPDPCKFRPSIFPSPHRSAATISVPSSSVSSQISNTLIPSLFQTFVQTRPRRRLILHTNSKNKTTTSPEHHAPNGDVDRPQTRLELPNKPPFNT